jgi:hypothetical protein
VHTPRLLQRGGMRDLRGRARGNLTRSGCLNLPSLTCRRERDFCCRRQARKKAPQREDPRAETKNRDSPNARNGREVGVSKNRLSAAGFGGLVGGGRSRANPVSNPVFPVNSRKVGPFWPVNLDCIEIFDACQEVGACRRDEETGRNWTRSGPERPINTWRSGFSRLQFWLVLKSGSGG